MKRILFAVLLPGTLWASARLEAQLAGRPRQNSFAPHAVTESLSVSASPASLSFSLVPRGKSAGVAYTLTVSWSFTQARTTTVWAYFASTTAALSGGSPAVDIPSSAITTNSYGSSTQVAFTSTNPFTSSNASAKVVRGQSLSGTSSGTATITMIIDCTTLTQLPAGTYTGVLFLQAQAI